MGNPFEIFLFKLGIWSLLGLLGDRANRLWTVYWLAGAGDVGQPGDKWLDKVVHRRDDSVRLFRPVHHLEGGEEGGCKCEVWVRVWGMLLVLEVFAAKQLMETDRLVAPLRQQRFG